MTRRAKTQNDVVTAVLISMDQIDFLLLPTFIFGAKQTTAMYFPILSRPITTREFLTGGYDHGSLAPC